MKDGGSVRVGASYTVSMPWTGCKLVKLALIFLEDHDVTHAHAMLSAKRGDARQVAFCRGILPAFVRANC